MKIIWILKKFVHDAKKHIEKFAYFNFFIITPAHVPY